MRPVSDFAHCHSTEVALDTAATFLTITVPDNCFLREILVRHTAAVTGDDAVITPAGVAGNLRTMVIAQDTADGVISRQEYVAHEANNYFPAGSLFTLAADGAPTADGECYVTAVFGR